MAEAKDVVAKEASDMGVGGDMTTPQASVPPQVSEEFLKLQSDLININARLVFAVATCECEKRDECEIFQHAREVAKILKKMQDVVTSTSKKVGKRGRR